MWFEQQMRVVVIKIINNKSVIATETGSGWGVWRASELGSETQLWCGKQSVGEYQGHWRAQCHHTLKDKPVHGGLEDF